MKPVFFTALALGLSIFALPASAEMAAECFAECNAMQEEYDALHDSTNDQAAISGGTTNQLSDMGDAIEACNARCAALEAVQDEFVACVTNARNQAEKHDYSPELLEEFIENCRLGYTLDRDQFFD